MDSTSVQPGSDDVAKSTGADRAEGRTPDIFKSLVGIAPQLGWITIAAVVLYNFTGPIRDVVLPNLSTIKAFGVEASFIHKQFEVFNNDPKTKESEFISARQQEQLVRRIGALRGLLAKCRILWIDDHPDNNDVPRQILERAGATFDLATSTLEAKVYLKNSNLNARSTPYDVIISDVGRDNADDQNGADFAVNRERVDIPLILYTASYKESDLGIPRNVYAVAHRPDFLIHYLLDALERGGAPFPGELQYTKLSQRP